MGIQGKTLLIPHKTDAERNAVAHAWLQAGGQVQRLDKFWEKPVYPATEVVIYGNDTFASVVAQVWNVTLVSPDDALLAQLDNTWLKRYLLEVTPETLVQEAFPLFCKPIIPKQFAAKVYATFADLQATIQGLSLDTRLLVSEPVSIEAEARGFVLHRHLHDLAVYAGQTDSLAQGRGFLEDFLQSSVFLPETFVVDIGYNSQYGWFIIEFNACWGAGLNDCDPHKILSCIAAATISKDEHKQI